MSRADDQAFWNAHNVVCLWVSWRADVEGRDGIKRPTRRAADRAAQAMADFSLTKNDPDAWALLRARLRDCLDAGLNPPHALVRALLDRTSPKRTRGRPAPTLFERDTRRTQASAVGYHKGKGLNDADALAAAEAWPALPGPKSAKTLLRSVEWASKEPT